MTEILNELPRLSEQDRQVLFRRLHEMGAGSIPESPEVLAALDEADADPHDSDLSVEDLRTSVRQWARAK